MNCWEILGIDPTDNRDEIEAAYARQRKFASGEEAEKLRRAYEEAMGRPPQTQPPEQHSHRGDEPEAESDRPLDASERQVVREVVIQVNALLNDSRRSHDVQIWKAILSEPPADRLPLRREIGRALEPQVRPMAENGSFPGPVVHFLAEWFEWYSLKDVPRYEPEETERDEDQGFSPDRQPEEEMKPQMVNFWPAVIGWIVGLAILASLFGGMGGGS